MTPTYTRHQRALQRLSRLLRERFFTVKQLAKRTRSSKVQVYRRLESLRATAGLTERKVREGKAGPLSRAFRILP